MNSNKMKENLSIEHKAQEGYSLGSFTKPEDYKSENGKAERECLADQYLEYNKMRLDYEDDARKIYESLKQSGINKLKIFFELDESALSGIEEDMADIEGKLGYSPDRSSRFDENRNDVLVNSAFLYHDRVESLKTATNDPDVDKAFVNAIIGYASAVEHDENSRMDILYEDDIRMRQEYIQRYQRRRSRLHNNMIEEFNALNDLAKANDLKPLIYRNLITNSSANNYSNDAQMFHDRVTLAHYVTEMINVNHDNQLPDPEYIKDT